MWGRCAVAPEGIVARVSYNELSSAVLQTASNCSGPLLHSPCWDRATISTSNAQKKEGADHVHVVRGTRPSAAGAALEAGRDSRGRHRAGDDPPHGTAGTDSLSTTEEPPSRGRCHGQRDAPPVTAQPAQVRGQGASGRHRLRGAPRPAALRLKGVAKHYQLGGEQVNVLVEFDFGVSAGEFVVVTGPSGAGKSTLLHVAGGLDAPDTGTVTVAGHDVWAMNARPRRVPATQPRIRLPVLQPGTGADRHRERVVAAGARRGPGPVSGCTRRGTTAPGRTRR